MASLCIYLVLINVSQSCKSLCSVLSVVPVLVIVFVFVYQRISIPLVLSSKVGSNAKERFPLNSERFIKSSNLNEHNEMY